MKNNPRWYYRQYQSADGDKFIKVEKRESNIPTISDIANMLTIGVTSFLVFRYLFYSMALKSLSYNDQVRYFYTPWNVDIGLHNPFDNIAILSIFVSFVLTIFYIAIVKDIESFVTDIPYKYRVSLILSFGVLLMIVFPLTSVNFSIKLLLFFVCTIVSLMSMRLPPVLLFTSQVVFSLIFMHALASHWIKGEPEYVTKGESISCESSKFDVDRRDMYSKIVFSDGEEVVGEIKLTTSSEIIFMTKDKQTIAIPRNKPKYVDFGLLPD